MQDFAMIAFAVAVGGFILYKIGKRFKDKDIAHKVSDDVMEKVGEAKAKVEEMKTTLK